MRFAVALCLVLFAAQSFAQFQAKADEVLPELTSALPMSVRAALDPAMRRAYLADRELGATAGQFFALERQARGLVDRMAGAYVEALIASDRLAIEEPDWQLVAELREQIARSESVLLAGFGPRQQLRLRQIALRQAGREAMLDHPELGLTPDQRRRTAAELDAMKLEGRPDESGLLAILSTEQRRRWEAARGPYFEPNP